MYFLINLYIYNYIDIYIYNNNLCNNITNLGKTWRYRGPRSNNVIIKQWATVKLLGKVTQGHVLDDIR